MTIPDQAVAVVTGAASGIGKAVADRLETEGRRVYRLDRRFATTGAGTYAVDVADEATVDRTLEHIAREGEIGALVHCAGVGGRGPSIRNRSPA